MRSYPKVLALGHRFIQDILFGDTIAEEKVDGSQISFGVLDDILQVRSRTADIILDAAGMFDKAVEQIRNAQNRLTPDYIYRGEYLRKPKHNVLCYDRTPERNIVIFDIEDENGNPLSYSAKTLEAEAMGFEVVPLLATNITKKEAIIELLNTDSFLGGTKIEGVVIKNYGKLVEGSKYMVGKYVSEKFKEKMGDKVKAEKQTDDIVSSIVKSLKTEARFQKAVQHLREAGNLQEAPQDIGNLLRELHQDIDSEETEYIKDRLFNHYIKKIKGCVCAGFPEWYKEQLLNNVRDVE
jgi:hypothetical protein